MCLWRDVLNSLPLPLPTIEPEEEQSDLRKQSRTKALSGGTKQTPGPRIGCARGISVAREARPVAVKRRNGPNSPTFIEANHWVKGKAPLQPTGPPSPQREFDCIEQEFPTLGGADPCDPTLHPPLSHPKKVVIRDSQDPPTLSAHLIPHLVASRDCSPLG